MTCEMNRSWLRAKGEKLSNREDSYSRTKEAMGVRVKRKEKRLARGRPRGACGPSEGSGGTRKGFQGGKQHGWIFKCRTPPIPYTFLLKQRDITL